MMFGSVGSCCVTKPSPPPTLNHMALVIAPCLRRLGPHHEPLSCRPPHTRYGTRHVERDVVELPDARSVFRKSQLPPLSSVMRHAAVVADDDALGVGRVDPHARDGPRACRRWRCRPSCRRRASTSPAWTTSTRRRGWSGARAPASSRTGARSSGLRYVPGLAAVGRAIEAARPRLRRDPPSGFGFGVVSASTIVYMMSGLLGEIAMPMRPFIVSGKPPPFTSVQRLAAVGALPERRARAAGVAGSTGRGRAGSSPRRARSGWRGCELHVHEAGLVVDELRQLPGLAAVRGLVEAAFLVGAPGVCRAPRPTRCSDCVGCTCTRRDVLAFRSRPMNVHDLPPSVLLVDAATRARSSCASWARRCPRTRCSCRSARSRCRRRTPRAPCRTRGRSVVPSLIVFHTPPAAVDT